MPEYIDSLGEVMNCDTIPNYDNILPFDDYWMCGDYITFHKMLMAECGMTEEQASLRVEQLWIDRNAFGAEWFCSFNEEFYDYFTGVGWDFPALTDITNNLLDTTENVSAGLGDTSKYLRIAIPIAILGIGVFYGYKAYKELK